MFICVWRKHRAGTEAPETAEEEIPCQKMHHYIRAPVQSPYHGDQPGNQSAEVLPPARLQHLFTWLSLQ